MTEKVVIQTWPIDRLAPRQRMEPWVQVSYARPQRRRGSRRHLRLKTPKKPWLTKIPTILCDEWTRIPRRALIPHKGP